MAMADCLNKISSFVGSCLTIFITDSELVFLMPKTEGKRLFKQFIEWANSFKINDDFILHTIAKNEKIIIYLNL